MINGVCGLLKIVVGFSDAYIPFGRGVYDVRG